MNRAIIKWISVAAFGLLIFGGVYSWRQSQFIATFSQTPIQDGVPAYETATERLKRFRASADAAARAACTNELGFYRVVYLHTQTYDSNPTKWTANATIEVLTGATGIARRQVDFRGDVLMGKFYFYSSRDN